MIDSGHPGLSIVRQCELVSISRSSFYREPTPDSAANLALMRLIDEQFLDTPWYGSRQMARQLRRNGWCVGRHRMRRLMTRMGLAPIYQRPKTSEPHPRHKIYPYLLRHLTIERPNQVWCADITFIQMRRGFLYLVAIMDWAKVHRHPELTERTVWQVFEAERPKLVPYAGRFDGFHAVPASVSKTCLVRFDNNKYSVAASAVGRPVEVHAYADRVVIRQDGRIVAEHPRSFGRGETVYDPWHYVPVLARKPGALRNGAPFKDWVLPAAMERVRRKLAGADDGNRQMVDILGAVLTDGLPAVEVACAEAITHGVHSADWPAAGSVDTGLS